MYQMVPFWAIQEFHWCDDNIIKTQWATLSNQYLPICIYKLMKTRSHCYIISHIIFCISTEHTSPQHFYQNGFLPPTKTFQLKGEMQSHFPQGPTGQAVFWTATFSFKGHWEFSRPENGAFIYSRRHTLSFTDTNKRQGHRRVETGYTCPWNIVNLEFSRNDWSNVSVVGGALLFICIVATVLFSL